MIYILLVAIPGGNQLVSLPVLHSERKVFRAGATTKILESKSLLKDEPG